MISGRKLLKIGWYMLAIPLIALFVSIIVSMIVGGKDAAVNPVTRLIGAVMAVSWGLSIVPLGLGVIFFLFQRYGKDFGESHWRNEKQVEKKN